MKRQFRTDILTMKHKINNLRHNWSMQLGEEIIRCFIGNDSKLGIKRYLVLFKDQNIIQIEDLGESLQSKNRFIGLNKCNI